MSTHSTKPQNITILGAGIMGLMNAYTLAEDGHIIEVVDPAGFPAKNASMMAGGMLAPYSEIEHMDERWIGAGLAGIDAWKTMPLDTGFTQTGSLLIAHPDDRYILERFKTHLPEDLRSPQAVQTLEPQIPQTYKHGIFLADEAFLNPQQTMTALSDRLKSQSNVTLSTTATKTPDITIDCRGMGADDPDIRGVKGEVLLVRNTDFTLTRPVRLMHPRYPLYIVPRDEHTFMIGATMIESADSTQPSLRSTMELMSALYALHPSFAEADIIDIKAGIRPSYPDNLPRITISKNESRISCNGLFRHGYLLAPVMAQCVATHLKNEHHEYTSLFTKEKYNECDNQRAA